MNEKFTMLRARRTEREKLTDLIQWKYEINERLDLKQGVWIFCLGRFRLVLREKFNMGLSTRWKDYCASRGSFIYHTYRLGRVPARCHMGGIGQRKGHNDLEISL